MSIDIDAIERLAALPVGKIEELISQFNAAELDAHKETTNALIRLQDKTADFYGAELLAMCAEVRELRGAMAAQDKRIETAGLRVGLFYGTDTPEYMADSIEELRAALEQARALAETWMNSKSWHAHEGRMFTVEAYEMCGAELAALLSPAAGGAA